MFKYLPPALEPQPAVRASPDSNNRVYLPLCSAFNPLSESELAMLAANVFSLATPSKEAIKRHAGKKKQAESGQAPEVSMLNVLVVVSGASEGI